MEDIQAKIRKLLALATSSNEHEAAAALRFAHHLMEKHAISEAQVRGMPTGNIDSETMSITTKAWRVSLVGALCRAHGCYNYYTPGRCVTVVGKPDARRRVIGEFVELSAIIDRLALGKRGMGRSFVESYRVGLVERLRRDMLEAQNAARSEAAAAGVRGSALVVVDTERSDAAAWAKARVRLKSGARRPVRNSSGYLAGQADGAGLYGAAARAKLGKATLKITG